MKNFKKITALFLALLMIASTAVAITITSSAANPTPDSTWYDANAETLYIDNLEDLYAMLEVGKADGTDNGPDFEGQTIVLRTDLDMAGLTWEHGGNFDFAGTFDGQNHVIKNFTYNVTAQYGFFDYVRGDGTVKNVSFVDVNGTAAAYCGIIARATGYAGTNGGVLFENVYVSGTVTSKSQSTGGFVGQHGSNDVTFRNCVSDIDVATGSAGRFGGFIGIGNAGATVTFEDCAFIGDISAAPSHSGCFVAMTSTATSYNRTITLNRCVVLGNYNTGSHGAFTSFNGATNASYTLTDCYFTRTTGRVLNSGGTATTAVTTGAISVKLGDAAAHTIASGTNIINKQTGIEEYYAENGGFLTDGDTINFTADNFGQKYPALAKAGWVVTNETVEYVAGKTVPVIMPASVAEMLNKTTLTAPNATSYLQIKNGTDGKYDVRFIGAVNADDLAAYETVGFVVVVKLNGTAILTDTVETKAVYTSIKADGVDVTAEALGADYLNVLQIAGFKAENAYDISVLSFAKKADGTVVYDYAGALEVTVQNAAVAQ